MQITNLIPRLTQALTQPQGPAKEFSSFKDLIEAPSQDSNFLAGQLKNNFVETGSKIEQLMVSSTANTEQDFELVDRITNLEMELRKVNLTIKKSLEAWKQIQQTGI